MSCIPRILLRCGEQDDEGDALLARIEPWGFFIVMALVIAGVISALWMQPVMALTLSVVDLILSPLAFLLN